MNSSSLSVDNFNFSITGSDSNKIFILFVGRSSYMNKNLNFLELISFKKKLTTNIFMTSHRGIFDIIDSKLTPLLLVLKIHQTQKNLFIHRILRKIIKSIFIFLNPNLWKFIPNIFFTTSAKKQKINTINGYDSAKRFISKYKDKKKWVVISQSSGCIVGAKLLHDGYISKLICFGYPFVNPVYGKEKYRTSFLTKISKSFLIFQGLSDEYNDLSIIAKLKDLKSIKIFNVNSNHDYLDLSNSDLMLIKNQINMYLNSN